MSCPPEENLSIYVDGELPQSELREVESHLLQCRRCRAAILALRDEVSMLVDVLHEKEFEPFRVTAPREQARGLVIGLAPVLGVAVLVVSAASWLLEASLPAGIGWLSPIQTMGIYEMILESIFMLRDRLPEVVELSIAVGGLFGVATLLTFLAGSLGNRLIGPGVVLLTTLGAAGLSAPESRALELRTGEEKVVIEAGEVLSDTLIVSAESIRIDGRLEGDLFAMAESIRISGEVDGSVVAVGDQVDVIGEVDGSLYVAGDIVRIEGEVDDRLYGFAEDFAVYASGLVEDDAVIFGERVRVDGKIDRDLFLAGDRLEVRGTIGRNLTARGEEVSLFGGASVAGDFDSQLPEGRAAEVAPDVVIGGERIDGILEHRGHQRGSSWSDPGFYVRSLVLMIAAFLVGMLLYVVRPAVFEGALPTSADFFRELGLGFVALVVTPIGVVLCFATVVGIPVGLIVLFIYLAGLLASLIVVSALLGRALLGAAPGSIGQFGRALLLGLLIFGIATNLPFIGGLLGFVALLTGMGMLVSHGYESWRLRST